MNDGDDIKAAAVLARLDAFLAAYDAMRSAHAERVPDRLPTEPVRRMEEKLDAIALWVQSIDRRFADLEEKLRIGTGSAKPAGGQDG